MKNPQVSIIIPAYNEEEHLSKCLRSILNQSYKNFEIIIVDNNSIDKTKEIITKFQKLDRRIKYLFEPIRKRGAARYRGEISCSGEIVLMTDADCIASKDWITNMINPILKKKAIAVQGSFETAKLNYWTKHAQEERKRNMAARIKDKNIGLLHSGNFAIKRGILKRIGHSNPKLYSGNDTDLEIKLRKAGHSLFFVKSVVYHFDPSSMKTTFRKFFYRGKWNKKIMQEHGQETEFRVIKELKFFIRLFAEIVYQNNNFKYDLISGISWRLGRISNLFNLKNKSNKAYDQFVKNTKNHYNKFYSIGGWDYSYEKEKRFLLDRIILPLNLKKGAKILEIGCGTGFHSSLLTDLGFKVIGVDISEKGIRSAKKHFPKTEFKAMDAKELSSKYKKESFDVIYSRGMSWYHYELKGITKKGINIDKETKKMFDLIKPRGFFVLQIKTDFSGINEKGQVNNNKFSDYTSLFSNFGEIMLITDFDGKILKSEADAKRSKRNIIIATKK